MPSVAQYLSISFVSPYSFFHIVLFPQIGVPRTRELSVPLPIIPIRSQIVYHRTVPSVD